MILAMVLLLLYVQCFMYIIFSTKPVDCECAGPKINVTFLKIGNEAFDICTSSEQ